MIRVFVRCRRDIHVQLTRGTAVIIDSSCSIPQQGEAPTSRTRTRTTTSVTQPTSREREQEQGKEYRNEN